jgi:hypothetical protein
MSGPYACLLLPEFHHSLCVRKGGNIYINLYLKDLISPVPFTIGDRSEKDRLVGAYQLLTLNSHESHNSVKFQAVCKEKNIITLCMPAHSSHILQPLNVGCFTPLKKAYMRQVETLMCRYISHIIKLEFLPAFKATFDKAIRKDTILGAFRGAGLLPFKIDSVISRLNIQLRAPTPLSLLDKQ